MRIDFEVRMSRVFGLIAYLCLLVFLAPPGFGTHAELADSGTSQKHHYSLLKVTNGVYSRVTARISNRVPRQFCQEAVDNLKTLLTSTSQRLGTLFNGRFHDVTIILPIAWAGSECVSHHLEGVSVSNWVLSKAFHPDFEVDQPHPIFGPEQPWSKQFGPCGQSGLGVTVPFTILADVKNLTRTTELRIFQEWLRNRYGVFPEFGFANDLMYPEWTTDYETDGHGEAGHLIRNEACNLTSVQQNEYSGESRLLNRKRSRPVANNSELNHMGICNTRAPSTNYDRYAPTKQNLLCEGKSAMEIISNHQDFHSRHGTSTEGKDSEFKKTHSILNQLSSRYHSPRFHLVLPSSNLRILLVLDISEQMTNTWTKTRDALFRFILLLPPGIELGIITFDHEARINTPPTLVDQGNKEGLFGRIPYRLSPDHNGCMICALELALPLITTSPTDSLGSSSLDRRAQSTSTRSKSNNNSSSRNNNNGIVVLISSSSFPGSSAQKIRKRRVDRVRKLVDLSVIPIYHIFFESITSASLTRSRGPGFLPSDFTQFGGRYMVNVHHKSRFLQRTSLSLVSILNEVGLSNLYVCHERQLIWSGQVVEGTFRVEDELNHNLWIVLTTSFKEDVESFQVTSPSGKEYVFPKYDHSIVYFSMNGANEPGIWSYSTKMHRTVQEGIEFSIEVFGEHSHHNAIPDQNEDFGITIRTWVMARTDRLTFLNASKSSHELSQSSEHPVLLFAEVTQDNLPIQNAKVVAEVLKPGVAGAKGAIFLNLRDDGLGYPDITAKDGIYSGYLTDFSAESGTYELSVSVTDNAGQARVSKPFGKSNYECCGSALPNYYTIPTPTFERIVIGESFHLATSASYFVRNGSPHIKDDFPPNRVTDLRVKGYQNNTLGVILQWTAPGDDLSNGKAARYEIRAYTTKASAAQFEEGIPVETQAIPVPESRGTSQEALVMVPWANQVFYYVIVAHDGAGSRSLTSNLAQAFVLEITTTTHMEMSFRVVNESAPSHELDRLSSQIAASSSSWIDKETMVYLMAGGITAFVLILTLLLLMAVCKTNKRKKSQSSISKSSIRGPFVLNKSVVVDKSAYDVWNSSASSSKVLNQNALPDTRDDYGPISWPYQTSIHTLSTQAPPIGGNGTPTSLIMSSSSHHHLSAHQIVGLPIHSNDLEMSSNSTGHSPTYNAWRNSTIVVGGPNRRAGPPPAGSDSGATHSTDCSNSSSGSTDSDHNSDKNVYNVPSSTVSKDREFKLNLKDLDQRTKIPASLSVASITFERDRKKRQESLV
ncbi:calcium-activated chloride channel regulator 1-like [Tigriopus californicus]|uniref:calcium-activated chloride channel regulator 1-like n=1 Tax=Tigriopus californicus TaxID=6832 RepID=UPI0027DA678D|nr:calcium-activated chloride channel regulator 1-like [Tigriopus californicus]